MAEENLVWGQEQCQKHIPSTAQVNQSNKATQSQEEIGSLSIDLEPPPNQTKEFECYVDVDFCGNQDK